MNSISDYLRDAVIESIEGIDFDDLEEKIRMILERNFNPEDIFSNDELTDWAVKNGFEKEVK